MDFNKTENQELIAETVRDFAQKNILPNVMEWDEAQHFPVPLFRKMGELGLMGVLIPEEYGGSGLSYFEYITVIEEISKVDPSIGLSVAAHNSLCVNHIYLFGTEEQKQKYLPKLTSGQHIGAWGLTEPTTGSDSGRMLTTAKQVGDYYILNGSKNFITHALSGDVYVVMVRTGEMDDSHGMSAFIIEKNTPGFTVGDKMNKLGMRASETGCLYFDNCKVPKDNLLGKEGEGFIQAMKVLDGGRISIASLALGISKGAYEASVKYSKEREQFGKSISKFQSISFKLADMLIDIEASEALIYSAADLKIRGEKATKIAAMAKYAASEACVRIATDAIQIHGGYGYLKDFPVEKFFRDSKLCTIGEGTSEIQKLVISRQILGRV